MKKNRYFGMLIAGGLFFVIGMSTWVTAQEKMEETNANTTPISRSLEEQKQPLSESESRISCLEKVALSAQINPNDFKVGYALFKTKVESSEVSLIGDDLPTKFLVVVEQVIYKNDPKDFFFTNYLDPSLKGFKTLKAELYESTFDKEPSCGSFFKITSEPSKQVKKALEKYDSKTPVPFMCTLAIVKEFEVSEEALVKSLDYFHEHFMELLGKENMLTNNFVYEYLLSFDKILNQDNEEQRITTIMKFFGSYLLPLSKVDKKVFEARENENAICVKMKHDMMIPILKESYKRSLSNEHTNEASTHGKEEKNSQETVVKKSL